MNKEYVYPYYEQTEFSNILDMLEYEYKNNKDKIAYSYREGNKIVDKTFKDVYNDSKYLGNYFFSNYKNKNIALMGENSYNWIVLFFGILLSGNVAVSIDKDASEEHLKYLLKQADCKDIYYSKDYCPFVSEMSVRAKTIDDINDYIVEGKKTKNRYVIDENKEAIIFFTSGTTGPNKGVVLSQKNILSNIYGATSIFLLSGDTVNVLPYHHSFGLITSTLMPFYYGRRTFINSSIRNVLKDIKYTKPETLIVVPLFVETFYRQIWKKARAGKKDKLLKRMIKVSNKLRKIGIDMRSKLFKSVISEFGGNLNYIICGGAYLDKKYIEFFDSIGITVLNGYGITECSPVVSVNRNNARKENSIGYLCRDVEVKIIDGEICVKGPNVMLGYYKDKKNTNKVLIDEYFHTGDLGYLDEDNFLYITGRKKNLIILSNGENISPEDIESVILNDKAVCEAVVYAKEGKIIAAIYPEEDYLSDQVYFDKLIHKYNSDKPKNRQVAMVELRTEEFEKNSNKKILRDKVEGK